MKDFEAENLVRETSHRHQEDINMLLINYWYLNNNWLKFSSWISLHQQTFQNNQLISNQNSLIIRQQEVQVQQMKAEAWRIKLENEKTKLKIIEMRKDIQNDDWLDINWSSIIQLLINSFSRQWMKIRIYKKIIQKSNLK